MKSTSTPSNAKHCTAPTLYAMRAECLFDCFQIRAALGPWLNMWRDDIFFTGIVITFSLKPASPTLEEVRWLVGCLSDCHVAAETLTSLDDYTGERVDIDAPGWMLRPADEFIERAGEFMLQVKRGLPLMGESFDQGIERLAAETGDAAAFMEQRAQQLATMMADELVTNPIKGISTMELAHFMAELRWQSRRGSKAPRRQSS